MKTFIEYLDEGDLTLRANLKEATDAQLKRAEKDFQKYAGDEKITIEEINDTIYVYGSELATLRIFKKYHKGNSVVQGYSKNLKTFYFAL